MNVHFQRQRGTVGRVAIVFFVLATCLRVWIGPSAVVEPVQAQIPDSGLQRKELLDEARRTNELLTEIKQLLKDHTFNVRVQGADKPAPSAAKTGDGGL